MKGKWRSSIVASAQLDRLSKADYLLPPERAFARAALVSKGDNVWFITVPQPRASDKERVCFVPHLMHGLGCPIHPFIRSLFFLYGLQLHHLSPNCILHIACYVMLCEAFLCCEPHLGLWLENLI